MLRLGVNRPAHCLKRLPVIESKEGARACGGCFAGLIEQSRQFGYEDRIERADYESAAIDCDGLLKRVSLEIAGTVRCDGEYGVGLLKRVRPVGFQIGEDQDSNRRT